MHQIADRRQLSDLAQASQDFSVFMRAKKQRLQGVSAIQFDEANTKLVDEVRARIYALRNRIVHAKRSDSHIDSPPLWPTSDEARFLTYDILLVQHLAQRALIRFSYGL
jgi:hypothetical protein